MAKNSDVSAFAAFDVGILPITQRFDAFAKIGDAYWSSDNTDGDGFGLAYGLGAKMKLNETTKLRVEWQQITDVEVSNSRDTDVNMISIGVELATF